MNEARWNQWLRGHTDEVLKEIGVKENETVLDFGCGRGAYTVPAARLVGRKGKVYAMDKNGQALKELKEKARKGGLQNIEVILSSELDTGLKEESVDVVLLYDVIHLVDRRAALLAEVHRVLKAEGMVSVYPMHLKRSQVLQQMRQIGFFLYTESYEGHVLNIRKEVDEEQ